MKTRIVEVTQGIEGGFNWGKFLFAEFDNEWEYQSKIGMSPLLRSRGWGPNHRLFLDIETCEGAIMSFPIGSARADLAKHRIWVCPMAQPLLEHLQQIRWNGDLDELPDVFELPAAPAEMQGYRRPGPDSNG